MRRRENTVRTVLMLMAFGLPTVLYGSQLLWPQLAPLRVIEITAAIPESGGFQPDSISVREGETVTLRFRSTDVTHGVAIGPTLGIDLGNIAPGQIKEVTLTFDKAGTYTFYCNTWCSAKHWRMRGGVHVYSANGTEPTPAHDPVIDALIAEGVNIDAMHDDTAAIFSMQTAMPTQTQLPSVSHGAELAKALSIPSELTDATWRHAHTPDEALERLTTANPSVSQPDLADVVAYLWTIPGSDANTKFDAVTYYAKNCAACHGSTGDGKGPMASTTAKEPASFADPDHMVTMRDDVLYAKIRRGGMGTDMPNFGTILTPEETWQIVNYLRRFSTAP